MTSAIGVARWMDDEIRSAGVHGATHEDIVFEIERRFGDEFVYEKENGNSAISKAVLSEFKKVHGGSIHWERSERAWYVDQA